MSIFREFFTDDNGRGSASRLNMIFGVVVGGIVTLLWPLFYKQVCGKSLCAAPLPGEIFFTFMLATGGVYGLAKYRETTRDIEQIKADSPNQPPAPPTVVTQPSVVINTAQDGKTKDMNVKVDGDVNVSPS